MAKLLRGLGRLTNLIIDKMQNYLGEAIRDNSYDIESTKKAIFAIPKHMIVEEYESLSEQHENFPHGTNCCNFCKLGPEKYDGPKSLPDI